MDLRELSIGFLRERIAAGEIRVTDICRSAIDRIEQQSELNAFITVLADAALAQAEEIDRAAQKGDELPPLAGTILAVKDVILIEGVRATAGSRILHNYTPVYTATAVKRLRAAGVIVIGKTNCDEFAM